MIELHHLTKKFGAFAAVDDLSLLVNAGEFYGFLGPNGAGKTTTIKMMVGLFTATSGTIRIGGFDVRAQPIESKSIIGYVPDQPFLYEKLTGREFLYFSAGLYRLPHAQTTDRINRLVERFEIGPWIDNRTENYSQGMRQRIVIAAALLHDPTVLIIDEPMVGLDPRSAHIVKRALKEKTHQGGVVFMSTHSLSVAEELCDRVGIIKDGRLIYENTIETFRTSKEKSDGRFESVFLELTR